MMSTFYALALPQNSIQLGREESGTIGNPLLSPLFKAIVVDHAGLRVHVVCGNANKD